MAGVGNYIDSYYEYLLKSSLLFDEPLYMEMFEHCYDAVLQKLMWHSVPILADQNTGIQYAPTMDSLQVEVRIATETEGRDCHILKTIFVLLCILQAFWPGLQVLYGDLYTSSTFSLLASSRNLTVSPAPVVQESTRDFVIIVSESDDVVTHRESQCKGELGSDDISQTTVYPPEEGTYDTPSKATQENSAMAGLDTLMEMARCDQNRPQSYLLVTSYFFV